MPKATDADTYQLRKEKERKEKETSPRILRIVLGGNLLNKPLKVFGREGGIQHYKLHPRN